MNLTKATRECARQPQRSFRQGAQRGRSLRRTKRRPPPRTPQPSDGQGFRADAFALRVWRALGDNVSRGLWHAGKTGDWKSVVEHLAPRASQHTSPLEFFLTHQATKLVSKFPHFDTGIDRRKVAERKFIDAEAACAATNIRFRDCQTRGDYSHCTATLAAVQRKIADILGPVPSLSELDFRFGPGANFGVRGFTTAYHKLTSALECTRSMIDYLPEFLAEFPTWVGVYDAEIPTSVSYTLVDGSDLSFVPKDAKTDRSICIEPLLNGLMQKGIGSYIRNRLLAHGVNLRDQTINQVLCQFAELRGLSTVDFSSASDMISYALVWDLLPPDWCELLDAARCSHFHYEGRWYPFQKFSSMGNAYTFELETLIFYALAFVCCAEVGVQPLTGKNLHVYGDDVIIPREALTRFKAVSTFCGFTVNESKSFESGPFFESCGHDVFLGHNVTPYRLKDDATTPKELTYVANLVVRLATRVRSLARENELGRADEILSRLASIHRWVVGFIPRRSQAFGPDSDSDDWLIAPFRVANPARGLFGWRHKAWRARPVKYIPDGGFWPLSYALYSAQGIRAPGFWDDSAPVLWSEGAALRSDAVRYRMGVHQSPDWSYPYELTSFW